MEDNYVYISVKLYLKDGQTEQSIQEIVSECDYSFEHEQIEGHEIKDIVDFQLGTPPDQQILFPVDPFDIPIEDLN